MSTPEGIAFDNISEWSKYYNGPFILTEGGNYGADTRGLEESLPILAKLLKNANTTKDELQNYVDGLMSNTINKNNNQPSLSLLTEVLCNDHLSLNLDIHHAGTFRDLWMQWCFKNDHVLGRETFLIHAVSQWLHTMSSIEIEASQQHLYNYYLDLNKEEQLSILNSNGTIFIVRTLLNNARKNPTSEKQQKALLNILHANSFEPKERLLEIVSLYYNDLDKAAQIMQLCLSVMNDKDDNSLLKYALHEMLQQNIIEPTKEEASCLQQSL